MYDGARVQPEDTPTTLGMDDGDAIDVVIEQVGGGEVRSLQVWIMSLIVPAAAISSAPMSLRGLGTPAGHRSAAEEPQRPSDRLDLRAAAAFSLSGVSPYPLHLVYSPELYERPWLALALQARHAILRRSRVVCASRVAGLNRRQRRVSDSVARLTAASRAAFAR